MPSRSLIDLDPKLLPLAEEFLAQCAGEKLGVFITCTYRSNAEQAQLYAQGRTAPGSKVTNAGPGQSPHNATNGSGKPASRAFDIAVKNADGSLNWNASSAPWKRAGAIGQALGLNWGGAWPRFPDAPHFELK